ncbi:unnamed protein product [Blumeria hordei]|uniref:Uncharacterized protein n=1 Tax=Blumeria hordei TaxID=2867405 RepID=A0A383UT46_BLUHO|nr:unnamed protein product [Blumeria hordei]
MRQQIILLCLSLIYLGAAGSDNHTPISSPQEAAVAEQAAEEIETHDKEPISCGVFTLQWNHVQAIKQKACHELKYPNAPDNHMSNILGEIYEPRRRNIPWDKKYYMYPLIQTVADTGGIISNTPYLFITSKCSIVAIYLRIGARTNRKARAPIQQEMYKLCWDKRKGNEAVVTDENGIVNSIYPHSFIQEPQKLAALSVSSQGKHLRR